MADETASSEHFCPSIPADEKVRRGSAHYFARMNGYIVLGLHQHRCTTIRVLTTRSHPLGMLRRRATLARERTLLRRGKSLSSATLHNYVCLRFQVWIGGQGDSEFTDQVVSKNFARVRGHVLPYSRCRPDEANRLLNFGTERTNRASELTNERVELPSASTKLGDRPDSPRRLTNRFEFDRIQPSVKLELTLSANALGRPS